jgi:hypothetical protein
MSQKVFCAPKKPSNGDISSIIYKRIIQLSLEYLSIIIL